MPPPALDIDSFLAFEVDSPDKHEYVRGEVFAMVGVSLRHGRIAANLVESMNAATRGGPCRVYPSDVKVRIDAADAVFYPDVVVSCDPRDKGPHALIHPRLVVEILSPSTAAYDRGQKFAAYRQLASLEEVALVESAHMAVDVFRRAEGGKWVLTAFQAGDTVVFESIDAHVPMAAIYDRLPPEEPDAPPDGA